MKTATHEDKLYHLAYDDVGRFLIAVWPESRPVSDEAFESHLEVCDEWFKDAGTITALVCALTFSPNAAQRAFSKRFEKTAFRDTRAVAILTDSALARGALTAIAWLIKQPFLNKGFAPSDVRGAMDWLCTLAPFDVEQARQALDAGNVAIGNRWRL